MIEGFKKIWGMAMATVKHWLADNVQRMGAALAYYGVLALPAILVTLLFVISIFYKSHDTNSSVARLLDSLMGQKNNQFLQQLVSNSVFHGKGPVATGITVVVLIVSATGVFAELQSDLNSIWGVEQKSGSSWRSWVRMLINRALLLVLLVAIGVLLVASLLATTALTSFQKHDAAFLPGGRHLWNVVEFAISCGIITVLFAMIFKLLPNARTHWRDVFVGSLVTAFLFTIGKVVLGIYLGSGKFSTMYGVASSIVVTLIWVYYSAQIFLFGAEFTQIYASYHGRAIQPSKDALWKAHGESAGEDREEADTSGKPKRTDWTQSNTELITRKSDVSPSHAESQQTPRLAKAEDTVHDIADRVHGWHSLRRKKT